MKMVMAFYGVKVPLSRLMREAGTNPATGTTRRSMAKLARLHGFRADSRCWTTLTDLKKLVVKGRPAIVNYILPNGDISHYAVVSGVDKDKVVLHDPDAGPHYRLGRREFLKRWYGKHWNVHCRWALIVTPRAG